MCRECRCSHRQARERRGNTKKGTLKGNSSKNGGHIPLKFCIRKNIVLTYVFSFDKRLRNRLIFQHDGFLGQNDNEKIFIYLLNLLVSTIKNMNDIVYIKFICDTYKKYKYNISYIMYL